MPFPCIITEKNMKNYCKFHFKANYSRYNTQSQYYSIQKETKGPNNNQGHPLSPRQPSLPVTCTVLFKVRGKNGTDLP